MSRKYKKVQRPTDELEEITCDWCGFSEKGHVSGGKFHPKLGDSYEFTFSVVDGEGYPSGGSGTKIEPDICRPCVGKLVKAMRGMGINLREQEWDF